jgi:uncharacterized protein (DUF1778 family)
MITKPRARPRELHRGRPSQDKEAHIHIKCTPKQKAWVLRESKRVGKTVTDFVLESLDGLPKGS